MKKIIIICLIMATFTATAQTENLNKEQTIAYINSLWSRTSLLADRVGCKPSFFLFNDTLRNSMDYYNEKREERVYWLFLNIPAYGNPIVRVFTFKNSSGRDEIGIKCDENDLFREISNYSDANLLKVALEHLFKLFNDEVK